MIEFFSLPQEKKDEIVAKFNINVDKDEEHGGCWRWLGKNRRYGYFRFLPNSKKETGAHRFAWAIKYSTPVPPQLLCCHSCDNPICVNPEHIFIGTHKQNMADCILKRRHKGQKKKAL
jgi:HNH endonuclease